MKGYFLCVFLFTLAAYFKPRPYVVFMEIFFLRPLFAIEMLVCDIIGIDAFIPRIKV